MPGMVVGSLVGIAGQGVYGDVDRWVRQRRNSPKTTDPIWKRALSSKWSPMKRLSNEEYAQYINQQLLKTEANIALLDEQIKKLKEDQNATNSSSSQDSKPNKS